MNWLQKCGLMLFRYARSQPLAQAGGRWSLEKMDFAGRYPQVLNACLSLDGYISLSPQKLAMRYMAHVLEGNDDDIWWQENRQYLTQTWFIWEFCRRQDLLLPLPALLPGRPPIIKNWLV